MHIMHIALGGCLSSDPVEYGRTEDTGGHIAFVLGASEAQAARRTTARVDIVTRAFRDDQRGERFWPQAERLGPRRRIIRLRTANTRYLEKAALAAEIPALCDAFLAHLTTHDLPDVIHAHFADAAVLAQAAQDAFGIPWVYSSHSLGLHKTGACDSARVEREQAAIDRAPAIVASSRDEAERQIARYATDAAGRVHCVHPGVAPRAPQSDRAARHLIAPFLRDPSRPVILLIARPVRKKNIGALIEAYAAAPDLQNRANLVILAGQRQCIGADASETGEVTTELFDLVDRHGLWGRVALPRRHSQSDVASLYALAARNGVFVNPALHEPFGLTVVEAAQAGVPVVATQDGGPPEVLETIGYGTPVDPTDSAQIARAIRRLLDDPDRTTRSRAAAERARSAFNWTGWAHQVAAIYDEIRSRRNAVTAVPRKILFSDIDNTLTGDMQAAAALRRYIATYPDLALIPATGRSINEARRILRIWGFAEPSHLISSVGSEVWLRRASGRYVLDTDFARHASEGWDGAAVRDLLERAQIRMQPEYDQRRWKVSCFGTAAQGAEIASMLSNAGLRARVVASHARFIDILPANAGKAAAAAHVARTLAVPHDACLAAGDSGNDVDLLAWASRAILPANASDELSAIAGDGVYRSTLQFAAGIRDGLVRLLPRRPITARAGRPIRYAAE